MRNLFIVLAGCLIATANVASAQQHSHYAGMEKRNIKALSDEQISGYRSGAGMGYAMAAELNGLPGPKHVIELGDQLELSDDQRTAAQEIYERMHARAVGLGDEIVAAEERLDALCGDGAAPAKDLKAAIDRIAALDGELRYTHMVAHFEMSTVLTDQQRKQYAILRGYETEP